MIPIVVFEGAVLLGLLLGIFILGAFVGHAIGYKRGEHVGWFAGWKDGTGKPYQSFESFQEAEAWSLTSDLGDQ